MKFIFTLGTAAIIMATSQAHADSFANSKSY